MMEWQPIETAPRDGTHILAAIPFKNTQGDWLIYVLRWAIEYRQPLWLEADGEQYQQYRPTHWMALPAPPKP